MARVVPDDLQPGMILSKPVTNANGVVMLAEGTELTDSVIEKMRDMDIDYVYVKGGLEGDTTLEQMLADLDKRFLSVEEAPYMDVIKKAVREHLEALYG